MRFRWLYVVVTVMILYTGGQSPTLTNAQASSGLAILRSDATGVALTWSSPAYELTTSKIDDALYSQLRMVDIISAGQPGHPELPIYSRFIGLPPSGEAELRIVELARETVQLLHPPIPAPAPASFQLLPGDIDPQTYINSGPTHHTPDATIYATNAFYPAEVVNLGPPQQIRDQRLTTLTIHPLRVNPVTHQLEIIRFLHVEITFDQPAAPALSSQSTQDSFDRTLSATLLNPEAVQWSLPRPDVSALELNSSASAQPETKVIVAEAGLHALTYADLQNAGLPVNLIDPKTFKISRGYPRQEIAVREQGDGDTIFEPGERLFFYAQPDSSRFVDDDVYFLTYNGINGLRMSSRPGTPAGANGIARRTTTAEHNQFYDPLYAGRDGDRWFWAKLATPNEATGNYPLQIEAPLTNGPAATLTVWLQGFTANGSYYPDHRVQVSVNGADVGSVSWDGKTAYIANLSVPANLLQNGQNQIRLTLPGIPGVFVEGVWLDAIALTYPTTQATAGQLHFRGETVQKQYTLSGWSGGLAVYDVTVPDNPLVVTGYTFAGGSLTIGDHSSTPATYLVVPDSQIKTPAALQPAKIVSDPPGGADYIIITHSSLASATAPLAAHRTAQGLRVITVDVEAIYDTYGSGRMDPEAIRNFLKHAYDSWPAPAPLYVLLVGDGSYDFKNHSGFDPQTLIPPYLAPVDPWWGETAADNQLVTLVGADTVPDMLIGRLAVNTPAETTTVVNKIIQYETNPAFGDWRRNQLFVSDNPDSGGNFHADADEGFNDLAGSLTGQRFYYSKSGSGQPHVYTEVTALRANFLKAFNEGASLVTFHGHSSWHQWAVESLLHLDNVPQLNNQNRLPVVLEMTCFTGFFHHPEYPTLDESLVKRSSGGAVASWAGTGLGVGTGHRILQAGFYQAVMKQGQTDLGAAILAGKMTLAASGLYPDLLDTYTLFGDPALKLSTVLKPDLEIRQQLVGPEPQPGQPVTIDIVVRNLGVGSATRIRLTDIVPDTILSTTWSTSDTGVTEVSGDYIWDMPDIGPDASVTITVSGTIDPALPPNFAILNRASVTMSGPELRDDNNVSTLIIGGSRAYLPVVRHH